MKAMIWFAICFFVVLPFGAQGGTTIDLSGTWSFRPDGQNIGETERWFSPDTHDENWTKIKAGKRWEDQGYPDVDGYAWYRKWVQVPEEWRGKKAWLVLGAVNDSYVLFCNGKKVNSFGDKTERSTADIPTAAELSRFLRFGKWNLIAIRVYDWGVSGGLWRLPCFLTTDSSKLNILPFLVCYVLHEKGELQVEVSAICLGNKAPEGNLQLEVYSGGRSRPIAKRVVNFSQGEGIRKTVFRLPKPRGETQLRVQGILKTSQGETIIASSVVVKRPAEPSWPDKYGHLKILNNFVTELLNIRIPRTGKTLYTFSNPREGWVFFSISPSNKGGSHPSLFLDSRFEALVLRPNPDTQVEEAMQFLPEGVHHLRVETASKSQLVVRTVPELIYGYYPSNPHIKPQGDYNWTYLGRYVLPHVNTIVTGGAPPRQDFEQWIREGRKWLSNSGLPGLNAKEPPAVEKVYSAWAGNPGVTNPSYGGIIVDEFGPAGVEYYRAWTTAVERLHADRRFANKTFYAYCGDLFKSEHSPALSFGRTLAKFGDRFAWEIYLPEELTEDAAQRILLKKIQRPYQTTAEWIPDWGTHLVIVFGYLSAPPESLNTNPGVDYKVFMDRQFHLLATDPTFWRLGGVMEYMASYADEEAIRWAHCLFRHYCIEGKRAYLSKDPYILPHIQNPDFADGLRSWEIEPAENGSVGIKKMEGFSWLEGRYPRTSEGDRFLWMKRCASGPNRIRQKVRALQPGRLYSLKFFSADLQNLHKKQKLAVSVDLGDVDLVKDLSFQFVFPSCYAHELGSYTRENPAYINYHRVVFRPEHRSTELVFSDWRSSTDPGGRIGQEVVCNFIEIQPFLAP